MKNSDVDWEGLKADLSGLKKSAPERIISCFEEKWAPEKVAEYILREIGNV